MSRQVRRVSRRAKHGAARASRSSSRSSVPVMVYRGTSGCRVIVLFHKLA